MRFRNCFSGPRYFLSHFSHHQSWYNNISKNNIILYPGGPIQFCSTLNNYFGDRTTIIPPTPAPHISQKIGSRGKRFFLSIFDDARRALHLHRTFHVCVHAGIRVECAMCIPPIQQARSDRKLKSQFLVCL